MLIHELGKKERMLAVEEASVRSRKDWGDGPDASMHHGVWAQLLKDLASPTAHKKAVEEWYGHEAHWYLAAHGIDQAKKDEELRQWVFLGEGRDLEVTEIEGYESISEGSRICSTCQIEKPYVEFHRTSANRNGRASSCMVCRRAQIRGDNAK